MLHQPKVISVGSINADFQVRVDRRPEPGETLTGHHFARLSGGKAANVAFQAQQLGTPAQLLGCVGDDDLAEQALEPLRQIGVDLSGVNVAPDCPTGVSMINVPPGGAKGIVLAENANATWGPEALHNIVEVVRSAPSNSVLVYDVEVPEEVTKAAAEAAAERGFTRILDPSPANAVSDELLDLSNILLPNPVEAKKLSGIKVEDAPTAGRAAAALARGGAKTICIKLYTGGCVLCHNGVLHFLRAPNVDAVDTTGAGDVFAGVFATWLSKGNTVLEAARAASAASAYAVTQYGSQAGCPDNREVEARLGEVQLTPHDPNP
ncbi:Ribokinase [Jannaschia seosinensis]|uniref:Ribokinase n=1 Tax=Jannaschia seosinensis TaxID=313367 RepID=A0A0M7B754_9RHOB|nr:PfkB family carbohydrate kinase [Jannaschia seosinensis]CUH36983.1 Ribokinase [Jannaschia seosinensis]